MPKAFTEQEKDIIADKLVAQGYELFSRLGLKKTTVEELAHAAGISKAAFYGFYTSKEELFMDVVEMAEERYREGILAIVDRPGPSPRARLVAVLEEAFKLWHTIPVLQFFTTDDFVQLSRRVPLEKVEEHAASDEVFMQVLIERCRKAGIPIGVKAEQMRSMMYVLLFAVMHESDMELLSDGIPVLMELIAAFCLNEVTVSPQVLERIVSQTMKGN